MTGLRATERSSTPRRLLASITDLGTAVAALATLLSCALATMVWFRLAGWPALKGGATAQAPGRVVAVTPWEVILQQASVALVVGLVFALEVALYRARETLLGGRWPRFPLPTGARRLLVSLGVVLFPVGAVLGFETVFPAAVDVLDAGGQWRLTGLARLAAAVGVPSGVAAQAVLVAGVLVYGRGGGSRTTATDGR